MATRRSRTLLLSLLCAALPWAGGGRGLAQDTGTDTDTTEEATPDPVVVYKMSFEDRVGRSINFDFWDEAWFAGPALGGVGTFVFTVDRGRGQRFYTVVADSGRVYTATSKKKKGKRKKRYVIGGGNNFATGFSGYLAIGDINRTIRIPGFRFEVARSLTGHCLAGDDESDFEEPAADGSQGFAGIVEISANLQIGLTMRGNGVGVGEEGGGGGSVSGAIGLITAMLDSFGYVNQDAIAAPVDDATGTATGDGTSTGDGSTTGDGTSTDTDDGTSTTDGTTSTGGTGSTTTGGSTSPPFPGGGSGSGSSSRRVRIIIP